MGRLQIFESIEAISTVSITLTSHSSIAQVLRQFQDAQLDSDDVLFRRHDPRSFDEEDCIYLSDLIYLLGSISTEPPPNPTPTILSQLRADRATTSQRAHTLIPRLENSSHQSGVSCQHPLSICTRTPLIACSMAPLF